MPNATLTLTRVSFPAGKHCGGHQGCGQCPDCKRNARRATAKTLDCDRPYLGLKSFASLFPAPVIAESKWLTNYWPKTRQALRREMLAEAPRCFPTEAPTYIIGGGY